MSVDSIQWQTEDDKQELSSINNRLLFLLTALFLLLVIGLLVQVYTWQSLSRQVTQEEDKLLRWQVLAAEYQALQGHKKTNWVYLPSVKNVQAWFNAKHAGMLKRLNITTRLNMNQKNQEVLILSFQFADFFQLINWLHQIGTSTNVHVDSWNIQETGDQGKVSGQLVLSLMD